MVSNGGLHFLFIHSPPPEPRWKQQLRPSRIRVVLMESNFDFTKSMEDALKDFGHMNLVILGKTGVGKSTLINAVFEDNLATTGIGSPVSQHFTEYTKNGSLVSIFDTKGFEIGEYEQILSELKEQIRSRKKTTDVKKYIHAAWYCIQEVGDRIESEDLRIVKELNEEIPVIVVLTKAIAPKTKLELFKYCKENANCAKVLRVLALEYETALGTIPAFGLKELAQVTSEVVPDAIKGALIGAQKVDLELKRTQSRKWIAAAVTAAVATGATPIPFSDAAVLAPIQVGMLAKISKTMGLKADDAFLKTMVSSAIGVIAATFSGRAIVTGLIKLIPGAGSLIGGAIAAGTAGTLTTVMGETYLAVLTKIIESNGSLDAENVARQYKEALENRK